MLPTDEMLTDPAAGSTNAPAPPPPPLQVDLTIPLSKEQREAFGRVMVRRIDEYHAHIQTRLQNLRDWEEDVEMMPLTDKGPWADSSAIRAPFTSLAVAAHEMRLNSQICEADPPFDVVARKPEAVEVAPLIAEVLGAILEEADWKRVAREVHRLLPWDGNPAVRVTWERDFEERPVQQGEVDEEQFAALVEAGVPEDQAYEQCVRRDEDGNPLVFLEWQELPVRDGVALTCIPWRDLVVLPVTAKSQADCYAIGERVWLTGAALREGAERGLYDRECVEELLGLQADSRGGDEDEDRADITGVEQQAAEHAPELREADALTREYLCYEFCWRHAWPVQSAERQPKPRWGRVCVHYDTGKLLRAQWLPYTHGQPHYVLFGYLKRPGSLIAASVAERLAVIQDAGNATLNQFIDLIDLMIAWGGTLIVGEGAAALQKQPFAPGVVRKVDNPADIKELPLPAGIPAALQQLLACLQVLKDYSDLLAATSNPALGRETDQNKTLGEVQLVLGQAMQIFETHAAGVALDWARVWDQVRWLTAQYAPGNQVQYRVSAAPGQVLVGADGQEVPAAQAGGGLIPAPDGVAFHSVPAHLLAADVDLVPAGLGGFPDAQTKLAVAQTALTTLTQHPLTGPDPETQADLLEFYLQAIRLPGRQEIMDRVRKGIALAQQQMQAAADLEAQAAVEAGTIAGEQAAQQQLAGREQAGMERARFAREGEAHDMSMVAQQNEQLAALQPAAAGKNGKK